MSSQQINNDQMAANLERIADLLAAQDANPFRVRAYRNGAQRLRALERPAVEILAEGGEAALQALPDIGEGLAGLIAEMAHAGAPDLLERLEAAANPQEQFAQVPGIGPELAERIVAELGIDRLEDLELAAYDGRLEKVSGFGERRIQAVQTSLAGLLSGAAQNRVARLPLGEKASSAAQSAPGAPPVALLLEIDAEYRQRAAAGELKKIAPRRFNPQGEAWLPVLKTQRQGWAFTALYSNTARAHELNKTADWVVIYYQREGPEDQVTVVTETSGPRAGQRVVRGREAETP